MLKRSLSQDQPGPGAPPSPLPLSAPGPPEAPEKVFFNSDPPSPEATERDPDTLAPVLTPGSLGPGPEGPREEEALRRPQPGPQTALHSPNNTWHLSSSEDERVRRPPQQTTDGGEGEEEERETPGAAEKRQRQTLSHDAADDSRAAGPADDPDRPQRLPASQSTREAGENGGASVECVASDQLRLHHEEKRGKTAERREGRSQRQQKREKKEAEGLSGLSCSPAVTPCALEGVPSDGKVRTNGECAHIRVREPCVDS